MAHREVPDRQALKANRGQPESRATPARQARPDLPEQSGPRVRKARKDRPVPKVQPERRDRQARPAPRVIRPRPSDVSSGRHFRQSVGLLADALRHETLPRDRRAGLRR